MSWFKTTGSGWHGGAYGAAAGYAPWILALAGVVVAAATRQTLADEPAAAAVMAAPATMVAEADTLAAARAALDDELYELARALLERHLQTEAPGSVAFHDALVLWARTLHQMGRHAELLEGLDPRAPDAGNGDLLFWRVMAHHHLGRHDQAIELAKAFLRRHPDAPRAPDLWRLKAAALTLADRIPDALAAFAAFDERYPDAPEAAAHRLEWAKALIVADDAEAAMAMLRELARDRSAPAGREAAAWIGYDHVQQGRLEQADTLFLELLAEPGLSREETIRFQLAYADVREQLGDSVAALAALETVLPLMTPGDRRRQARIQASRLMFQTGRADEAATLLREIIRAAPQRADVAGLQLGLGNGLLHNSQYERAAAEFQVYLDAFTDQAGQAQALAGMGWALLGLQRYAEAAEAFDKAARLFEDPARRGDVLFKAADAWFAHQRYASALDFYQRVAADTDSADTGRTARARFMAAETLIRLEQYDAALDELRAVADAYADRPIGAQALLRGAKLHEQRGDLIDALAAYDALLAAGVDGQPLADGLLSQGMLLYQLFRFDDALAAFERLIDQLPGHAFIERARFMTLWSHSMVGREVAAVTAAREYLERHPESPHVPEVLFRIAEHDFNHDRLAEAQDGFFALAARHPESPVAGNALLWAGRAALRRRNYREAIEAFARLAQDYADSPRLAEARFSQADALSELGEFAEAIVLFDEVINRFPDSYLRPAAIGRKGDCLFMLGTADPQRFREAMATYQRLLESPATPADMQLQAVYKIGRCHEQLDERDLAFEQYHAAVVRFREMQRQGMRPTPAAVWGFQRAAFDAAAILEARQQWRQAVRMLQRVVDAGVPAASQADERIRRIRADHWLLFY